MTNDIVQAALLLAIISGRRRWLTAGGGGGEAKRAGYRMRCCGMGSDCEMVGAGDVACGVRVSRSLRRFLYRRASWARWATGPLLIPKFGTRGSLICGPSLVKNPVQRRMVSSKGFGRGTCGRQFASVRQRDCLR
jgi:hypothetical protein